MENPTEKIAIVIVGSVGTGKSTVFELLKPKFADSELVLLDDFWALGERRFRPGPGRYLDLRSKKQVLFIELAGGEPQGRSSQGATLNPSEWLQILKEEGRKVFLFRLQARWFTIRERLAKDSKRKPNPDAYRASFDEQDKDRVGFAGRCGIGETVFEVAKLSAQEVAEKILQALR